MKSAYAVGMKLTDALHKGKVSLLIFLPECSKKNEEKIKRDHNGTTPVLTVRYDGEFDIKTYFGYEMLKAIGITDENLAKALYELLNTKEEVINE